MKCFQHADADAVAICVACGRAMCRQCARTTNDDRFVCIEECGAVAVRKSTLDHLQLETIRMTARSYKWGGFALKLLGGVFLLSGGMALLGGFVLGHIFPRLRGLPPMQAIGLATYSILAAVVTFWGAKLVSSHGRKIENLLDKTDQ